VAKDKSDKKQDKASKGRGKGKKDAEAAPGASVAGHPRAAQSVRRAKGFGGLAGFALALALSHSAGITHAQMLERALIAGVAGYLLAWACAVTVWRHLVTAEIRSIAEGRRERERTPGAAAIAEPAVVPTATPAPPAG
jgi:hypothetical protein